MRILVFNWRSPLSRNAGGAEKHCYEIFKRLAENEHVVQLVTSCDNASRPKTLIYGKIQIFHVCRNELLYFLSSLLFLSRLSLNSFDVIVEDISKLPIFWPLFLSKVLHKPFIIIVHHIHGKTLFKEIPFPLSLLSFFIELAGLKLYALFNATVVTVSESTKRELVTLGFRDEDVNVIPNGLNYRPITIPLENKSVFPLIIYFGRVKRYKRIDHLIQAVKYASLYINNLKLVVAGKGDAEAYSELHSLSRRLKLEDTIEFHGEVSEEEKNELLKRAWIYAVASMKEGFGISVVEAQAFGLPVIAYMVPGIVDSVEHMKSGILVKDGDIQAFSEALKIICNDKTLREKLSMGAIKNAEKYDWDKSAMNFLDLLTKITKKNKYRLNHAK